MSSDKTLAEILAHRMRASAPIPVPVALAILRQLCDALDYAHNLRDPEGRPTGVIHGDVSPPHIWISEAGRVTLVGRTTPNGTFAYMAPEYVTTGLLDTRADLFGLGVVAHEMLGNRPLFAAGSDREILERVCTLPIPPPASLNPQVPPDLERLVMMALSRDPNYRYQHAAILRDGLHAVAQSMGLDGAWVHPDAWIDLFVERLEPAVVAAPAPVPPPATAFVPAAPLVPAPPIIPESALLPGAPPPSEPELWNDDTNQETRVQPYDPKIAAIEPLDAATVAELVPPAAVAAAPVRFTPAPAAVAAAPVRPAPDPAASMKTMMAPPPEHMAAAPVRPTPDPAASAKTMMAPLSEPVAQIRFTPAPASSAKTMMAPPPESMELPAPRLMPGQVAEPVPRPMPELRPMPDAEPGIHAAFDAVLGPEPTQIGAMPLISFGDTPMVSDIGKNRFAPASIAPPMAAYMPETTAVPPARNNKKIFLIVGIVIVIVGALIAVLATR